MSISPSYVIQDEDLSQVCSYEDTRWAGMPGAGMCRHSAVQYLSSTVNHGEVKNAIQKITPSKLAL